VLRLLLLAGLTVFAATPDHHSYANFEQVRVTHIALDLTVSFESKSISGTAELFLQQRQPTSQLVLDTNGVAIAAAETSTDGKQYHAAAFKLGNTDPILGAPLTIALPAGANRVRIAYTSTAQSAALHWLTPAQTAGNRMPFFYTQSWSIHARSWVPLQDSPQVKFTYSANIHAPKGMLAVMSAENTPDAPRNGHFHFEMRQPIPPHGLALAVGDLAFQPLGTHSGVYADPAVVEQAAKEFEETEAMLNAAERIAGPYRWERYDILLLPPGAVYGGMENPRLTFLASSELAGDKSKSGTVAHELAHSWSGNLVTNATWSDIWISEGITSYLTRRIQEVVNGRHRAELEIWQDWQHLKAALEKRKPTEQILNPPSKGRDPDNLLGPIPYQKGALFLRTLEARAGRIKMDEFLRRYFARFAYESITSAEVTGYMKFVGLAPQAGWLNEPALPAGAAIPKQDPLAPITTAAKRWQRGGRIQTQSWITPEWINFLSLLRDKDLARADRDFHFTESKSRPILSAWLQKTIALDYQPALARLEAFAADASDPQALLNIYSELANTAAGRKRATGLFQRNRARYADSLSEQISTLLKP